MDSKELVIKYFVTHIYTRKSTCRWLLGVSQKRPGRDLTLKLSSESVGDAKGSGSAIRKKVRKIVIILWAIWDHRNTAILYTHRYNLFEIIEQVRNTYCFTLLYYKTTYIYSRTYRR